MSTNHVRHITKAPLVLPDLTALCYIEKNKIVPIATRFQENSFIYMDGDYIVLRGKISAGYYDATTNANILPLNHEHCSFITLKEYGPFGTFQWYGKIGETDGGEEYAGGFENHHGYPLQGVITNVHIPGHHYLWTSAPTGEADGGQTQTECSPVQDWSTEHLFKIEWTSAYVKLYVDGLLVATNITNIPQVAMGYFWEACTYKYQFGMPPP